MSPLNAAICTTISYTLWVECCGKNVMKANIYKQWTKECCGKNVMKANICKQWTKVITIIVSSNEQFCKIYLNYLPLRSKIKVTRRSLQYVTHHLMVMHPHTKYHWPFSKEKNVMARTRKYYLKTIIWPWGQRSRSHEGHCGTRHTTLCSWTHIPNIIDLSRKKKMLWPGQENTI
jgi:hypothetical protein